ncbi:MAG: hypothetical protein DK306_000695 [Chloroflexi bacterium]|nr:MAG: hypothetical protein DK306_000695 [Chloroflexota bacterium]
MKICPACHQETFDGRRTCHRCGTDVSDLIPLELPTEDVATLVARAPFRSRHGALQLSLLGIRFVDRAGQELFRISAASIELLEPIGNADLRVRYRQGGGPGQNGKSREVRLRVRWARVTDRTTLVSKQSRMRPWLWGARSDRGNRSSRARSLVRDRWESALTALVSSDRYALRRG